METMETHLTPSLPVTEPQDKSTSAASILDANNLPILFQSLEKKLLTSLQDFITNTLSSLKVHVEGEIQAIRENLSVLELRLTKLEQVDEDHQRSPCFVPIRKDVDKAPITSVSEFSTQIEKMVDQLTKTIEKQQKIIENAERKKREQNVIIVGLNESEMNTETMLMPFFEDKLNISPPPITYTKRLGRKNEESVYPRPLLVAFKTLEDKKLVMKRTKILAGTRIYINNDLTKEQMAQERKLRGKRRQLKSHPSFKEKKIQIYKGELWADGNIINEVEITPITVSD